MVSDEELFKKRLSELADRAYENGRYFFTDFLSLAELNSYYQMERALSHVPAEAFGGTADCERVMIRFGDRDLCGYDEPFPIACVEILPLAEKFSENLSHRDYLGALMNLGIKRAMLGDIVLDKKRAFAFCAGKMAPYIIEALDKVRHTNVKCRIAENVPKSTIIRLEEKTLQVSAARCDSVIAKLYNISRSESVELFRAKKVFVNGRLNKNNSAALKLGDKVSVRGYGRFSFAGVSGETRKGKLNVKAEVYV